ncbi:MAG TPA: S4 domain-containing protein [Verrucomicrobiae bacterium]|jgi:ribosome-associated heat shock protein Hsp15|nr:S4 domain-containing protein [Verrucomicrobiae bacterium]
MDPVQEVRIDKWLWAVRLYKTRALAAEACRGGHVRVGGQHVKASRLVRVSELISARAGDVTRTVKVTALLENRVGPKLVPNFLEDLTPASEYLRALQVKQSLNVPQRPKGSGRPTKKERRELEKLE